MLLVCSGAYIESELASEFGNLPPSFLPLGGKRLYEYQAEFLGDSYENKYISLPFGFVLPNYDKERLNELGFQIIFVRQDFSIGEVIQYCINISGHQNNITILYGDTLIKESNTSSDNDMVGVSYTKSNYSWHNVNSENDGNLVYNGLFRLSSAKELVRFIALSRGDYIKALELYSENYKEIKQKTISDWYDFGHAKTFFTSRTKFTTERAFNNLSIIDGVVSKKSQHVDKISAESMWFENLPEYLKVYTPQYIGTILDKDNKRIGYKTEYQGLCSLNELFVFGRLPKHTWKMILQSCNDYLNKCLISEWPADFKCDEYLNSIYKRKTESRLNAYCESVGIDINKPLIFNGNKVPCLKNIADTCISRVLSSTSVPAILHGDFCFSNIFFDFRSERVKVIDPRAMDFEGNFSLFGDLRYDCAKLLHSYIGQYDTIISGRFKLQVDEYNINFELERTEQIPIDELARIFSVMDIRAHGIMDIVILLFLSMLPLHYDNPVRQRALLANAIRLYCLVES